MVGGGGERGIRGRDWGRAVAGWLQCGGLERALVIAMGFLQVPAMHRQGFVLYVLVHPPVAHLSIWGSLGVGLVGAAPAMVCGGCVVGLWLVVVEWDVCYLCCFFFLFNVTATTEIYTG